MLGILAARSIAAGGDDIINGIRLTLAIHGAGCLWLAIWLALA